MRALALVGAYTGGGPDMNAASRRLQIEAVLPRLDRQTEEGAGSMPRGKPQEQAILELSEPPRLARGFCARSKGVESLCES